MTNQERLDMIDCVAEGVRKALISLKLVEEVEHPVTHAALPTKTLAQFVEDGANSIHEGIQRLAMSQRKRK